jgi:hypothetical protein
MLKREEWNLIPKRLKPPRHTFRFLLALAMMLFVSALGLMRQIEGQTSTCNITYKLNTHECRLQSEVTVRNDGPHKQVDVTMDLPELRPFMSCGTASSPSRARM